MTRWILRAIGLVAAAIALSACHANSSTFTVDTTDDTVDINPGAGLGVDWCIDGVLFRDNDELAPFEVGSIAALPTGVVFNGQGAAGSGNSLFLYQGTHVITAVDETTGGQRTYTASFQITDP